MPYAVAKVKKRAFNVKVFLNTVDGGRTVATYKDFAAENRPEDYTVCRGHARRSGGPPKGH
jgi:hypothetical protein